MKAVKYILITIVTVFAAAYLSFLFILPNVVDMDKYAPQITKLIQDSTGFQVKIKGLKLKTSWNLSSGVLIKKSDFKYPNGEKFAQINDLDVRFSILTLFNKKIKIDNISASKALMNIKVEPDGKFLMSQFIGKNAPKTVTVKKFTVPMQFSRRMPKIDVKYYRFSFIDMNNNNNYSIKGNDLNISDFVLGDKIKVGANGIVVLNGRKQITYRINVFSKYFPEFTATSHEIDAVNIMKVFRDLYNYNLHTNIYANLKIKDLHKIYGKLYVNNIIATINGKTLKPGKLDLLFVKQRVRINSEIHTNERGKAIISGVFNFNKYKYLDLSVNSDRTDLGDVLLVSNTLLQMIGNKDLNGIEAEGKLNANFNVKTDFKNIRSSGFLRLNDARITNKLFKVVISSVFADIDFSQDRINILQSRALLNGEPVRLKGSINQNAYANLELTADSVSLRGILALMCQFHFLRENNVESGLVRLKASLSGRLDKAKPKIEAAITNVNIFNNINNTSVLLKKAAMYFYSDNKQITRGITKCENLRIIKNPIFSVSIPNSEISFDDKDIYIKKSSMFINNSKIKFYGEIKNYKSDKPDKNITIFGLMRANDFRLMLPPKNRIGVSAVGRVPMIIKIKGKDETEIQAQMLANDKNHIGLFDVNTLQGKTSLVNVNMFYSENELRIREFALYALNVNHGLSYNFNANIATGTKVAEIFGKVIKMSYNPTFSDVNVVIPNRLTTSLPGYPGSSINMKGELELNGQVFNPQITGYLTVPKVNIPTMKTSMRSLVLHFNKNSTSANCKQMLIANSFVGFNAVISNDFSKGITVNNLDFIANQIDMDELGIIFKQENNSKSPIRILNGQGTINKFKMGNISASNIKTDVTLLHNSLNMNNIRGNSFYGKIGGNIIFNMLSGKTWINMQGRGLSAGPAIKAITNVKDDIAGTLDFDSKISMVGFSVPEIQRSLKGNTIFIISNGKMGSLGKLEHLISAQNLLNSNIFNASINVIAKAVAVKNTGYYKYIKGKINFANGWANISPLKASGPTMSLYMTGRYNIEDNAANLIILGRLSDSVVKILGPFGDLSVSRVLSYIPNIGVLTTNFINQMTTPPNEENTSMIPPLSPQTEFPTRQFKVMIDGNLQSQNAVKYFKWLSLPIVPQNSTRIITPEQVQKSMKIMKDRVQDGVHDVWEQVAPVSPTKNYYTPPKRRQPANFINNLPDLRN